MLNNSILFPQALAQRIAAPETMTGLRNFRPPNPGANGRVDDQESAIHLTQVGQVVLLFRGLVDQFARPVVLNINSLEDAITLLNEIDGLRGICDVARSYRPVAGTDAIYDLHNRAVAEVSAGANYILNIVNPLRETIERVRVDREGHARVAARTRVWRGVAIAMGVIGGTLVISASTIGIVFLSGGFAVPVAVPAAAAATTTLFSAGAAAAAPAVVFATTTATTIAVTATASSLGVGGVALGATSAALLSGQRAKPVSLAEERANALYLKYLEAKEGLDEVLSSLRIDLTVVELHASSGSRTHRLVRASVNAADAVIGARDVVVPRVQPEMATVFAPPSSGKKMVLQVDASMSGSCHGAHS